MCALIDTRIAAAADLDHGVLDAAELHALGASRDQIRHRVRTGRLIVLYRGVYAVGHRRLTLEGRWLAAVKACGPGAVLSHRDAAALWDLLPAIRAAIHVTVPPTGRAKRSGLVLHRCLIDADSVTVRNRIRVTSPTRTLADLAATATRAQLIRAVEAAQHHRLLDLPSMRSAAKGRPGAKELLAITQDELPHTRSELEAAFLALCDEHEIERPHMNVTIHGHEVDAYWPERNLAVELDSRRHHLTPRAFEQDRRRDADLHRHGIATLRFTYAQIARDPGWVVKTLA
jgi:very-short-patch-repair endonuclease